MFKRSLVCIIIVSVLMISMITPAYAQDQTVVHAVFFYSPTCGHCHLVMEEVLPVLQKEYGKKLVIAQFDTSTPEGNALWQAAVTILKPVVAGVPTLVVGDKIMVGSRDIPDNFPAYIDHYLELGGVDWPNLPGIERAVADLVFEEAQPQTVLDKIKRDLTGNIIAIFVMVSLIVTFFSIIKHRPWQASFAQKVEPWGIFIVILIGLTAASYLSYVETTQTEAVCGPIGDCNTVQQSEFAVLFGFLPLAVLGVIDYVTLLILTLYEKFIRGPYYEYIPAFSFLLATIGVLFSTFLSFLQPFVIGATCSWCLTSAVCTLLISQLSADSGWKAFKKIVSDYSLAK
jgi:uncharacterized membrane protein